MKRTKSRKPAADQKPTPRKGRSKRCEWVSSLPAIITAATALVEVLLKHFHP